MCNTLNKIKEYQSILKDKIQMDCVYFNDSELIKIGDNVFITGVYLNKNYVISKLITYNQVEMVLDIDIFDDVILQKICHILCTKIS
jgi:hypothetical protein